MSNKSQKKITIPRWFDRHLHVRDGDMLKNVLPCTLNQRATGAIIMGNLPEPTSTIKRCRDYRDRIQAEIPADCDFEPKMTLYLTDHITPEEVVRGFEEGVWCAAKLYMADQDGRGGTTGSSHGVKNLKSRYEVFKAMEQCKMPLLGHFEAVEEDVDEFDREKVSMERDLEPILESFPRLPVVFEHITTKDAADLVASGKHENLYATVTAHHLMINRNAMFKDGMNPGHYCKPVPKREMHRKAVRDHVTSGNRRFGAGTDSAPHDESVKSRCYGCAAGIFTAPVAVEMYATVFDEDNALENLGAFMSRNFIDIYGMKVSEEKMTIKKVYFPIPEKVGPVQVFLGDTKVPWRLVGNKPKRN